MESIATVDETTKRAPDFGTLLWEAIQQFLAENPGIDRYEASFADGTKVRIKLPRAK